MVHKKDQVLLEWKDVEFFVPIDELPKKKLDESEILFQSTIPAPEQDDNEYQKIEDEEINYLKHSESGLPVPQHILKGKNHFKQVLQKNSGYVKPNELVAIMGPSGSGKTSLLNVISQRSNLSKGSFTDGSIFLNGRQLVSGDFGRIGAFVQQDDILVETLTPKELLTFAARIMTNLNQEAVEERVERTLKRLGLVSCQDTQIGGFFTKGLSGGERKRTSIAYEIMSEPSLLLLDEPTSGLDSHTATNTIQMLRTEAYRGQTIMATIHQPSSEIFMMFDRVIFLSEGFTIYNGPPELAGSYFEQFGLKRLSKANPADKLSIIAASPRRLLDQNITIEMLAAECVKQFKKNQVLSFSKKQAYDEYLNQLSMVVKQKKIGAGKQIWLLTKRNMKCAYRNPMQIGMFVFVAIAQSSLMSILFHDIGDPRLTPETISHSTHTIADWLGMNFLVCADGFLSCASACVIAIPLALPVLKREQGSRMYTPTAYYTAMMVSNILSFVVYPILVSVITFWSYAYPNSTFTGFCYYFLIQASSALVGLVFGQLISCCVNNDVQAFTMMFQVLTCYYNGSGVMVNAGPDATHFTKFLTYISPLRYLNELGMRLMLAGRDEYVKDYILSGFGFTWGIETCSLLILTYIIIAIALGMFVINQRAKSF